MKAILLATGILMIAGGVWASGTSFDAELTPFQQAELELKYSDMFANDDDPFTGDMDKDLFNEDEEYKQKSPFKAFVLSLAVPGLGQLYYGSRWKPLAFVGVEALGWYLHVHYDGEGDRITDEFEAMNDEHWSQADYEQYLQWSYGFSDDDSAEVTPGCNCPEISHHLPDTKTQQYYEMTGKYDQFVWGWSDARIEEGDSIVVLEDYSETNRPARVKTSQPATVPISDLREVYNQMRGDADVQYDRSTKMLYVIIANHLVSAFEAYLTTMSINNAMAQEAGGFSNVRVTPELRSYHSWKDTPFVRFSYKF